MTCDFTPLSTVFQSYQKDGRVIMKDCLQWNPIRRTRTLISELFFPSKTMLGLEP